MWTANYRYEYPLQINRIWEKGTKWKSENVISSFRHYDVANWTPPWSKWIVAMLSEWISWMKKFGSPRPIPSPSYHPGQPHWQRNRWLGWKWVLMTKWRNDEMTFSTSDLGEKSFKEIVYINIYIYIYYFFDPNTRFPKRHFVISSLRHYKFDIICTKPP